MDLKELDYQNISKFLKKNRVDKIETKMFINTPHN